MTSKLLIDEYPLIVLPTLATRVGLKEAIVLQQIHYWLVSKERAKETNYYLDGRWWVYNTAEEWKEQLPFMGVSTIRRVLASLREKGIVVVANYNRAPYDKTLWYSIDYDALNNYITEPQNGDGDDPDESICSNVTHPCDQNEQMDVLKMSTPIPETNTETTAENNTEDSTPSGVAVGKPDEEPLDFTEPPPRQPRTPEQHALGVIQAIANHQKRHDPGGEQPIDPTWANLPVGQAIILTAFYRLAALPPPQAKTRRASAAFAAETLYQETGGAQEAVRRMSEFFHRRREGDESCQFTITTPQSIVNTIAAWQEKTYNPVVSLTLGVN